MGSSSARGRAATAKQERTPYAQAQEQGDEALRRSLLDVASGLLVSEGPQALTMRRIAAEAGCSTTVLYKVFGSKLGIADQLYREGFDRLRVALEHVPRRHDPLSRLGDLAHAYRRNALENSAYYGVMFQRVIPHFVPTTESKAHARRSLQPMIDTVAACVKAGTFAPGDPVAIAEVLWAAAHGAVSLELAGGFHASGAARERFRVGTTAAAAWFRAPT